jgi:hypothetical protein
MKGVKNNSSISPTLILTGIWFINTLIVIFGLPFLIYKKVQEIYSDNSKTSNQESIKRLNQPICRARVIQSCNSNFSN